MNEVVTTLIILIVSVVLGTGVVLYGTNLYQSNSQSSYNILNKQIVNYHEQGVDPKTGQFNKTEISYIVAFDNEDGRILLTDGKAINLNFVQVEFWDKGTGTSYCSDCSQKIIGDKVIINYYTWKSTCDYVFDFGQGFTSSYPVQGFNFTQIPNSTNYDFRFDSSKDNSCTDLQTTIENVEVFLP